VPTLAEVVATLDSITDRDPDGRAPTIFAKRPWTPESEAIVLSDETIGGVSVSAPEFAYLLEVNLAKEVIEVWSSWRGGAVPSLDQATRAVIHYAEYDAWQPLDDDQG
jgi:hypothetical protein